jgi:hypothetical protein
MQLSKLRVFLEDFKLAYEKEIVPPKYISGNYVKGDDRVLGKLKVPIIQANSIRRASKMPIGNFTTDRFHIRSSFRTCLPNFKLAESRDETSFALRSFRISEKRYVLVHKNKVEQSLVEELKQIRLTSREPYIKLDSRTENIVAGLANPQKPSKIQTPNSSFKIKMIFANENIKHINRNHQSKEDIRNESFLQPQMGRSRICRVYSVKPNRTFQPSKPFDKEFGVFNN